MIPAFMDDWLYDDEPPRRRERKSMPVGSSKQREAARKKTRRGQRASKQVDNGIGKRRQRRMD